MAKASESTSRPLATIPEDYGVPHSPDPNNNASPTDASPGGSHTPRRSSLFFQPGNGADDPPTQWYCSNYELTAYEKNAITKDNSHAELLTIITNSNEELQLSLDAFADNVASSFEPSQGDPMATAIDHKFEMIRYAAQKAVEAFDEQVAVLEAEKTHHDSVVESLQTQLSAAEKENASLLNSVKDLLAKVAELRAQTTTMAGSHPQAGTATTKRPFTSPPWDITTSPQIVDITVPKAYRMQVLAAPVTAFEGSTDVETMYTFLKGVDHHIRLIRTFNDTQ
ncbi:hypothetical protein BJ508DRAFT_332596 [Ascobolus immersus RN42]|uniref:Uncharacterized protein n=1 Tax=Ascobolus immersus RN42 TaxID=1160509 RepID=A0A3N4HNT1_ASCIM|nr:hypothetical protein BJ508DRAFT_332596 [Ascobolus immersus RN42]